jgi:hypothetical protein
MATIWRSEGSVGANRWSHVVAAQEPAFPSVNRRTRIFLPDDRQVGCVTG